uniref:helix-turn-helix domain-containing protein n=1 Tax=Lactiplantibacillus plantarum TaxID=1590 RepID=UPI000BE2CECB
IVDFGKEKIGFSGMSSTDFEFTIKLPTKFMGLRLVPNTFTMLTGRSASEAMDTFLLLSDVYSDFDTKRFFSLSFNLAKQYLINFIESKLGGHTPDIYTCLFNNFSTNIPKSVSEICQILNISQSQCQRVFLKHYGLTPKVVLSILRFQRALYLLVSTRKKSNYIMDHVSYYDQPHFIKDFKKNIGLTPIELLKKFDK